MSVVANVAINLDARGVLERLRQINAASQATAQSFSGLSKGADQVRSAVERSGTGFARASEVQGVFSAKVRNTESAIRAQIAALRDIQGRVQLNGALYQKAAGQIREYEAVLAKTNQTQKNQAGSANILAGSLGRLAISYVGLRTAQEAIQAGIQREESERRLTFLARGYGEVAQAQELAAQSGKRFGLSATESNQQFAQLYGRLRPLNVSLADINAAFVGFNTAAKVSGATTAESAGALLQLTQALGSGVLRGQELNSVLEQAPGLVVALTKELNKPVSEIRKLAEEGEITSDVVIRALKRAGTEGADELAAAMNGPAQAVKNLQNEFENFQVAATEDLLPSIIDGVRILTNSLRAIAPIIKGIGAVAGPVINYINQLIEGATGVRGARILQQQLMQRGAGKLEQAGVGRTYKDAQGNVYSTITGRLVQAAPIKDLGGGGGFLGGSGGGGGGKKKEGKSDAEREAERLRKELERSLEVGDQLGTQYSRQVILLDESSEIERKRLQIQFDFEDRAKQISELKNAEQRTNLTTLNAEIRRLDILKLQGEELKTQVEQYYKRAGLTAGEALPGGAGAFRTDINLGPQNKVATFIEGAQKDLQDLETRAISVAQGIGDALANSLVGGIQGLIAGTQSAKEVFANFLQSIGQVLAQEGTKMIATYIAIGIARLFAGLGGGDSFGGKTEGLGAKVFGSNSPSFGGSAFGGSAGTFGFAGRASGGPVASNTPYMVGEQGPELFVPNAGGSIVNNKDLRSAMTNGAGSSGGTVLNMSFETTNIGGVEYVSRDQLEAAMAATRRDAARDGAKRGMSMTLDKLQQSPGTRGRVGLR